MALNGGDMDDLKCDIEGEADLGPACRMDGGGGGGTHAVDRAVASGGGAGAPLRILSCHTVIQNNITSIRL